MELVEVVKDPLSTSLSTQSKGPRMDAISVMINNFSNRQHTSGSEQVKLALDSLR